MSTLCIPTGTEPGSCRPNHQGALLRLDGPAAPPPSTSRRMMNAPNQRHRHHHHDNPIVTSAESESESSSGGVAGDDSDASVAEQPGADSTRHDPSGNSHDRDMYYDDQADERDEAYVNQHLRLGGTRVHSSQSPRREQLFHEAVGNQAAVAAPSTTTPSKPFNSDAVLSCPCCFTTICMDCQRHERYPNQYRAMFVMNIAVNYAEQWMFPPHGGGGLVPVPRPLGLPERLNPSETSATRIPHQDHEAPVTQHQNSGEYYYTVTCANCQTQVAVLDPVQEVYHFTGCVASG